MKALHRIVVLLLSIFLSCQTVSCDTVHEDSGSSSDFVLKLEHSFDNGRSFSSRGSLAIHSMRSGAASTESSELKEEELDALQKLCKEDGLYLVRLISTGEVASYRFVDIGEV